MATPTSPLTRSVGSMTSAFQTLLFAETFQLTRSVGNVTSMDVLTITQRNISTHTLRGERDLHVYGTPHFVYISTHTLRGERDIQYLNSFTLTVNISTHTLRGERDIVLYVIQSI